MASAVVLASAVDGMAAPPSRAALDRNTRDFVRPVRLCAQVGKALLGVLNAGKGIESSLVGYAGEVRDHCQDNRASTLVVPRSGFASQAALGLRVFSVYFSALRLFEDGVRYESKALLDRARRQFVSGWATYKNALAAFNARRAKSGLAPLPLIVR